MFERVRRLLEMIRFSHTLFALPFALLAAVMAYAAPARDGAPLGFTAAEIARQLAGILVCMAGARSAAMAFNRIVDRRFDALNPRTADRHLPRGEVSLAAAVGLTAASSAAFFLGTLLLLPNWLPLALAAPFLAVLLGYSFAKRFTALVHFWLGAALMLAPVGAWIAIRGLHVLADPLDLLPAAWLGAAVLLWVAGFDMIYATMDCEFDRQAGLHSAAARWGVRGALRLAAACHLGMVLLLLALPRVAPHLPLSWLFDAGTVAVAALLVYEHALVRPHDLRRVNAAFFQVNVAVSVGLFLVGSIDLLW